jgi:hypothetical protein
MGNNEDAHKYRLQQAQDFIADLDLDQPERTEVANKGWAVVRYAFGDDHDDGLNAVLDGWYSDQQAALKIADDWSKANPRCYVVVVAADKIHSPSPRRGTPSSV